jgi:hypothetical protein
MTEESVISCPYCGSALETGYVLRRPSGLEVGDFRLKWLAGDPPPKWKLFGTLEHEEPVGSSEATKGSLAAGQRCERCRKIILDY